MKFSENCSIYLFSAELMPGGVLQWSPGTIVPDGVCDVVYLPETEFCVLDEDYGTCKVSLNTVIPTMNPP